MLSIMYEMQNVCFKTIDQKLFSDISALATLVENSYMII